MIAVRRSIDFAIDVVTSTVWGVAAFIIAARFGSPSIDLVLGLAVFVSALTFVLTTRRQEREARHIAAGACPQCEDSLVSEHEHRRWDTTHQEWLPPLTTWHCESCGFRQEAPLACESCPTSS